MKKLAIGCGLVLLVGGIAAAVAAYYVYRQVQTTVSRFAELGQVAEIERGVRVRGGFTPPSSEELTDSQIERLVRVQTTVRERLGARIAEFETKYRTLLEQNRDAALRDLPAVLAAYRDLVAVWLDAKRSQVEALNQVDLSLEEYHWIRRQVYRALGAPFVDFDIGRFAEEVRGGSSSPAGIDLGGALEAGGPEANRRLIERFRKQLEDNLPLASFGL